MGLSITAVHPTIKRRTKLRNPE